VTAPGTDPAARRAALAARCGEQRAAISGYGTEISRGLAPTDGVLAIGSRLLPLLAVGGVVALIVSGPGRALRLARGGLAFALLASDAASLVRGLLRR
jgi:S1-C subfamily serine protease